MYVKDQAMLNYHWTSRS